MNDSSQTKVKNKSVAIIITSHNYACYLTTAVDNVLNQTHLPVEILIIDDSSADDTQRIADQYSGRGVRYLRVENQCAHLSRYDGLLATQLEFVLFLDADNTLPPDYIDATLREFTDPAVGVVYADLHKFGDREEMANFPEYTLGKLFREKFVDAGSLIRREALLTCDALKDCFDERLLSEDYWGAKRTPLMAGSSSTPQ
ncbi:glycosyltransferase family 2 protein [Gimesia fumaroli]|uniref:Glycosyltransferase EpsH n=1 Tax=Gimesia fumaroli TaxID=2527976 RepID=A0A518I5R5_9PLAN|nr:glycosyltransferase family 2 protein [Gimesia fumaroli]QDV48446.1 Putative glycosyltransferase EpsH [Gimesia fumaroli]